MLTARVTDIGAIGVEQVEVPVPGPNEVLVRTVVAGVCGSDLHRVFGGFPTVRFPMDAGQPGHEGVGVVEASSNPALRPGMWVLTVPDHAHGRCFAEWQVLPERFVVPYDGIAAPEVAVVAQQMGTVIFALKRFCAGQVPGVACVFGAGPAGVIFTDLLARRGYQVLVVEPVRSRRMLALRHGAAISVSPDKGGPEHSSWSEALASLRGGRGADLVIDASGRDEARSEAVRAVVRGGVLGFYGLPEGTRPLPLRFDVLFEQRASLLTVVGAQAEPGLVSFREAIDEVRAQNDRWSDLVTHRFGLQDIRLAFATARNRDEGVAKVVVNCSGS